MTFAESSLRAQRWLLAAMLFGSAVIIFPAAVEPFMLPKATFVVSLAVALAAVGVASALWTRAIAVPWSPVTVAAGAFALALVITTITSPTPLTSAIGFYSRYTGLVPYLAYLLIFFVTLRIADDRVLRLLRRTALVALGFVVAYGLSQAAGFDPVAYGDLGLGATFSFLGNVNFSAAWAGAVAALALVTALTPAEPRAWRLYAAALTPLTVLYAVLTGTSQGPVVAAVALGWVALLLSTAPESRVRGAATGRLGLALALAGAAAVAAGVVLVAALPYLRAQLDQSLVERPDFWAAAVRIFVDHPVLGSGLDTYAHHFLAYRPTSHALSRSIATTDAPHSVPLGMFSNGGLLLGLTYVAFVVLVGLILVRGVLGARGARRMTLAGFGGSWLGYQAQSAISFDVPPLALLHFLSAGVIVAVAAPPRWHDLTLPGRPAARPVNRRGKEYGDPVVPASTRVLHGVVALTALVMLWFASFPLRADLRAASAAPLANSGQFDAAAERFESAADLNPAEASYAFLAARGHEAAGRPQEALEAAAEASRRDPGTVQSALFAARQAVELGQANVALGWYEEALERDPRDPPVVREVARFLHRRGDAGAAEAMARRALALNDDDVASLVLLGELLLEQGKVDEARAAVEKALLITPADMPAAELLAQINSTSPSS